MWRRTVDCLGVAVSITSVVPSIDGTLLGLLRSYADAADPVLRYELRVTGDGPVVLRDGIVVARCASEKELVSALSFHLYPQVVRRAEGVVLHAGAIVGGAGRAIVFSGVSGAGKSTLMRALLARGYDYLSEECVALLTDGSCRGLARALHIEDPGMEVPPGFTSDAFELYGDNGISRIRLFHPPPHRMWRAPARPVALIALQHGPDAPNTLTRLSSGEALARLWPMTFQGTIASPLEATSAFAIAPGFALDTSTPEHAQRLVLGLAEELGVVPR